MNFISEIKAKNTKSFENMDSLINLSSQILMIPRFPPLEDKHSGLLKTSN